MSLVGFRDLPDDVPDAYHSLPPLTTVRQDFCALGTGSLAALLEVVEGAPTRGHRTGEAQLMVRESSIPLPVSHRPPPAARRGSGCIGEGLGSQHDRQHP